MQNCIFTAHCMESFCDRSCPILAEVSYLLDRNDISMDSPVFQDDMVIKLSKMLSEFSKTLGVYVVDRNSSRSTIHMADLLTYCAICQNWKGSRLHCDVYHLRYSQYLDELKMSWSSHSESDSLQYTKIWLSSAKVVIISHLDYVKFSDFESQTLLNIIQMRESKHLKTIIVTPPLQNLFHAGRNLNDNLFFKSLLDMMSESKMNGVIR